MSAAMERARAGWGMDLPDWIAHLASACDLTSQSAVAREIGYSAATVSTVLSANYRGNLEAIEEKVRVHIIRETVRCPALGLIEKKICETWRRKARAFKGQNLQAVLMAKACCRCPVYLAEASDD